MSQRMSLDPKTNVDTRLSRLETIIDSISVTLDKIQTKLDNNSKINWAPVSLGVTIFLAVVASFSTIYNTRITTLDDNVKIINTRLVNTEVVSTEARVTVATMNNRLNDLRADTKDQLKDVSDRVRLLEGQKPLHRSN